MNDKRSIQQPNQASRQSPSQLHSGPWAGGVVTAGVAALVHSWNEHSLDSLDVMDDLKRELQQDSELQDAIRLLTDRLSTANLDKLQAAAERNDLEAIAKALDLPSVSRLEALASFLRDRANHYKRYPDLEQFARRRP